MQELKLADHLMPLVRDGQKRLTIRLGVREITLGVLRLSSVSDESDFVEVDVSGVFKMSFGDIPTDIIYGDGASNHVEMLRSMQDFYPEMEMTSVCTVVQWG